MCESSLSTYVHHSIPPSFQFESASTTIKRSINHRHCPSTVGCKKPLINRSKACRQPEPGICEKNGKTFSIASLPHTQALWKEWPGPLTEPPTVPRFPPEPSNTVPRPYSPLEAFTVPTSASRLSSLASHLSSPHPAEGIENIVQKSFSSVRDPDGEKPGLPRPVFRPGQRGKPLRAAASLTLLSLMRPLPQGSGLRFSWVCGPPSRFPRRRCRRW